LSYRAENSNSSDGLRYDGTEKNRPSQLRVLINVGAAIGLCVVIVLVVVWAFTSGYLDIDEYSVMGNSFLTDEEVYLISGIETGKNLYTTDLRTVESNLAGDPRIADAVVRRRFPDTVIIEIEERVPVAVIAVGEDLYKVAGDGLVITELSGQYEDLPFMYGFKCVLDNDASPVGKRLEGREVEDGLKAASKLRVFPALAVDIDAIRVDNSTMLAADGAVRIRYDGGFDGKHAERLARVWAILDLQNGGLEIDTRYGNDVIVRRAADV